MKAENTPLLQDRPFAAGCQSLEQPRKTRQSEPALCAAALLRQGGEKAGGARVPRDCLTLATVLFF